MKKARLTLISIVSLLLVGCSGGASSSSSSSGVSSSPSTSSGESSSSGGSSSSSSEPSSSSSSSAPTAEYPISELASYIAYSASKYDAKVSASSILSEAKELDSSLNENQESSTASLFLLSYCAFDETLPEKVGARSLEFYANPENPTFAGYSESSPYTSAFRFLSDAGIVDSSLYGSSFDASSPIAQDDAFTILDRLHYYYGTSEVDDFYAYTNYDLRYENCPAASTSPDSRIARQNLSYSANLVTWTKDFLLNNEDAYSLYNRVTNIGESNLLGELISYYDAPTTAADLLNTYIEGHNTYGYSPLYESMLWSVSDTPKDASGTARFEGWGYIGGIDNSTFSASSKQSEKGGEYYNSLINENTPIFSALLGEEKGANYATLLADYAHEFALTYEALIGTSSPVREYPLNLDMKVIGDKTIGDVLKEIGISDPTYILSVYRYTEAFFSMFKDENLDMLKAYSLYMIVNHYKELLPDTEVFNTYLELEEARKTDRIFYYNVYLPLFEGNLANEYASSSQYDKDIKALDDLYSKMTKKMSDRIDAASWLSNEGKEKSKTKLNGMKYLFGETYSKDNKKHPFLEINYSSISSLLECRAALDKGKWSENVGNLGATDDPYLMLFRTLSPFAINAFYSPDVNGLGLAMGYIAVNGNPGNLKQEELLAKYGVVLGHEIGHGYDSSGFTYNPEGKQDPTWMSEDDKAAFEKLKESYGSYIDGYQTMPGFYTNGEVILNEAVADNIGINNALEIGKDANFDQKEFFRHFATLFGGYASRSYYESSLLSDSHPWARARVNILFSSMDDFHELYNTKEGDFMYVAPQNRIAIY